MATCSSWPILLKPLPVLRQGRHASWLPNSPHNSCSCHNTGQLLSKLMLCTHNTRAYAHRYTPLALHDQQPLTKFTVSHLIKAVESVGSLGSKSKALLLLDLCLANLGSSSCCCTSMFSWMDPGSLMFQRMQPLNKLSQSLCISLLPAD